MLILSMILTFRNRSQRLHLACELRELKSFTPYTAFSDVLCIHSSVCLSVGFHYDVHQKSCWENYHRVARELAAISEHIATLILSIILTAPHSEVLPKSLAGCWEKY